MAAATEPESTFVYVLRAGDNPWTVSERYLADMKFWPKVVQINLIRDDRQLRPHQTLRIPIAWLRMTPSVAEVLHHRGTVQVRTAEGEAPALRVGLQLGQGATIGTGDDGTVTFKLEDGSVFLVRSATDARIERLVRTPLPAEGSTGPTVLFGLSLQRGAVDNLVRRQPAAGRYEIKTRAATAAVRGTEFRVRADDMTARTEVLEGSVGVGNERGRTVLPPGTGTLAAADRPPQPPRTLLPAPSTERVPPLVERLPIDLPLLPVQDALRYRSELLAAVGVPALIVDQVVEAPRVRLNDAPNGDYILRVRAIDRDGIEGLSVPRPLRVHARPFAPLLLAPAPDATLTETRPTFLWARAEGRQVQLALSRDARFSATVSMTSGEAAGAEAAGGDAGTARPPADLAPGVWYWRARAVTAADGVGPWSDVQTFRRVVPGPGVEPPAPQQGAWTLRWPVVADAARYQVEVTPKAPGATPVLDAQQTQAQVTLKDLNPGQYSVRVRAFDDEGHAGPWGPPSSFEVAAPQRRWDVLWLLLPVVLFGL